MRVLKVNLIEQYMAKHSGCRASLRAWLTEARAANWKTPADVKARYPKASILSENRVVFDIAGGAFRLLCQVAYQSAVVVVKKIGTHREYDKWDL